jgi:uncharacterized membrane protein
MNHQATIQAALAGLLALGIAGSPLAQPAQPKADQEKCYGIAKAGQNDCGTAKHACAAQGAKVAVSGTNAVRWGFLATSAPIGCIISVYGASPSSDTNIYFRLEGEGDGTYHGPTGIGAVPIGDGGSCFNMFQQNEDFPFVATFVFKHC